MEARRPGQRPVHLVTTAGAGVGRGHLSRTLTLAETLVGHDATVSIELIDGRLDGATAARAARAGVSLSPIPAGAVVVVDLPDPDDGAGRVPADQLVVFDDREAFRGEAAIVVQPSMPTWAGRATAARVLAGFAHAPVGRRYVELRDVGRPERSGGPIEVVVCFGGSDPSLVTARLAPAVAAEEAWRTTTVVGADYAGGLDELGPGVVRDPADLPERLARAELALIGAGTMKFEVACLGRPVILVAAADDQLVAGPPFASTGAADYLGDGRTIEPERVVAAVRGLIEDRGRRAAMGSTAAAVVDGRGAERVAVAILSLAGYPPGQQPAA